MALVLGVVFGLLGFVIGSSAQGGFNQTTGMGWGIVGAALFGLGAGCTGFLLGFGGYLATRKESRGIAIAVILVGLLHPLAILADKTLRPHLIEQEWAWWETALAEGLPEAKKAEANRHLSGPTRTKLVSLLDPRSPKKFPEATLAGLDDIGWLPSKYAPMPEAIARRKYQRNSRDSSLAQNPTIPTDLIREMSGSKDLFFLRDFLHNPAIPDDVLAQIRNRLTALIEEEGRKPQPEWGTINGAKECLQVMVRNRMIRERDGQANAPKQ